MKMRSLITAITTLFIILISLPARAADGKDSVFDRIMRSGTIRCGYYVFPPVTYRDPSTDALSGLSVDIMNLIGERADLKIEWTEEVSFGNWVTALQADRFDMVCTPMWPEIPMARVAAFSEPMFYAGLSPMVRANDERFTTDDLERFNQPDITFLAQDGNALASLTKAAFPNAKLRVMPAMMDGPTMMQEVITGKADVILLDKNGMISYNQNSPVKLKLIAPDKPIKVQPFTLAVRRDEMILRDFISNAIQALNNDGSIERLLQKWEPEPYTFLRAPKPYEVPQP